MGELAPLGVGMQVRGELLEAEGREVADVVLAADRVVRAHPGSLLSVPANEARVIVVRPPLPERCRDERLRSLLGSCDRGMAFVDASDYGSGGEAIQAAIDAVSVRGGRVYLPAAEWRVKKGIVLPPTGVVLWGDGVPGTQVHASAGDLAPGEPVIRYDAAAPASHHGIECMQVSRSDAGPVLRFAPAGAQRWAHCWMRDVFLLSGGMTHPLVEMRGVLGGYMKGVTMCGGSWCLVLTGSHYDVGALRVYLDGTQAGGILIDQGGNHELTSIRIEECVGPGLRIQNAENIGGRGLWFEGKRTSPAIDVANSTGVHLERVAIGGSVTAPDSPVQIDSLCRDVRVRGYVGEYPKPPVGLHGPWRLDVAV